MPDICSVPGISHVCGMVGDAAVSLVTAPFDWLASAMAGAAKWIFEAVWSVIDTTTLVDVTRPEYTKVYNIVFGVAVFVTVAFFLLQVMGGMIRREPAALTRAATGSAKSILGSFVVITLVAAALEITDQLCIGIVHAAGTNMDDMGGRISVLGASLAGLSIKAPGVGAVITIFLAGLAVAAAFLVWASLLIRKALLLIAVVFAPIALAGATWDQTRGWVGKWASFVLALILSKVVLVVIFLLATAQVSAPIDAGLTSVSEPIAGVVLMLIAGFAPYMTYKAISFMGFDAGHAMSSEQEAKAAMHPTVPSMLRPGGKSPDKVLDGGGASSSAATGAVVGGGVGAGVAGGVSAAKQAVGRGVQLGQKAGDEANRTAVASAPEPPGAPVPTKVPDRISEPKD